MVTNISVAKNGARAWALILRYIGKSATLGERGLKNEGHAKFRLWFSEGTPETLQAQFGEALYDSLQIGDLCLDTDNLLVYVCSIDMAVSTDATWTLISVD